MTTTPKKRVLLILGIFVLTIGVLFVSAYIFYDQPLPLGHQGKDAEKLAEMMEQSVGLENWKETGAIEWTFADSINHLWDRKRNFARVRWDENEVLLDLGTRQGIAFAQGRRVGKGEDAGLIEKAYSLWANDSFWLNPIAKLRDQGVSLQAVELENSEEDSHKQGLLVTYGSGGVTPGDSYLWILAPGGRPLKWRMWVSITPVGGLEASFEGWQKLDTGALVSTLHRLPLGLKLRLSNIRAAKDLSSLAPGGDPFQPLVLIE